MTGLLQPFTIGLAVVVAVAGTPTALTTAVTVAVTVTMAVIVAAVSRSVGVVLDRVSVNDQTTAGAGLTLGGVGLQQAHPQTLTGHLHQAKAGDLGHLVLGAVADQELLETAQHQVLVLLQHHVDEVDDDHPAHVA